MTKNDLILKQRTFQEQSYNKWYDPNFEFLVTINDAGVGEMSSVSSIDNSTHFLRFVHSIDDIRRVYEALTDLNFR